jgi:hypothetical protein
MLSKIDKILNLSNDELRDYDNVVNAMNERNKVAWKGAKQIKDTVARQEEEAKIIATGFNPGSLPYTTGRISYEALRAHKMGINIDEEFVDKCEKIIINSGAEYAFHAANKIFKAPWPEAEAVIATDPQWSVMYNNLILRTEGRFIGENAIAQSPEYSVLHARMILEGRFHEGEKSIANDARSSYEYALYVVDGRFPEGEAAISSVERYAEKYAEFLERKSQQNPESSAYLLATESQFNEEAGE